MRPLRPLLVPLAALAVLAASGTALAGAPVTAPSAPAAASSPVDPVDCAGPARDPAPGTAAFARRDAENVWCSEQRQLDQALHPNTFTEPRSSSPGNDAYRSPDRHDGARFRHDALTVRGAAAELFRPCAPGTCPDLAEGLPTFEGPYPAVAVFHGLASRKEHLWWAAQTLAENGYLVVTLDGTASTMTDLALTWLHDPANPYAAEIDRTRVGVAGHSLGGGNALRAQGDPRAHAIVSFDPCSSVPCGDAPRLPRPEDVTPTLYLMAEYTGWPGYPQPRTSVPGTLRAPGFADLRDRGVDTMVVTGRATTHLDWVGSWVWGSRYAELTWVWFTTAWFDRHLKGRLVLTGDEPLDVAAAERARREEIAAEAFGRLTATVFDDSADRHNLSQGVWDPVRAATSGDPLYGGNVPYAIAGQPVADRLSFYHRSVCFVSVPDYAAGDGGPGAPVRARADTGAGGSMRDTGCRPSQG